MKLLKLLFGELKRTEVTKLLLKSFQIIGEGGICQAFFVRFGKNSIVLKSQKLDFYQKLDWKNAKTRSQNAKNLILKPKNRSFTKKSIEIMQKLVSKTQKTRFKHQKTRFTGRWPLAAARSCAQKKSLEWEIPKYVLSFNEKFLSFWANYEFW